MTRGVFRAVNLKDAPFFRRGNYGSIMQTMTTKMEWVWQSFGRVWQIKSLGVFLLRTSNRGVQGARKFRSL